MIIATLFAMLFGGGSTEYFYIAEFDKSVNKYVEDESRKKEIKAHIKDYKKAVKEYNKKHAMQVKLIKEKNLDKSTTKQDYLNFFNEVMDLRKEQQPKAIAFRLSIQPLITDNEWQNIVSEGKKATSKADEKEKSKKSKKVKPADQELIEIAKKYISEEEKNERIMEAYDDFKEGAIVLKNAYDNLNAIDNPLLVNKSATKFEMEQFTVSLNTLRLEM